MNLANLTQSDKEKIIKIFLYGVAVGRANIEITDSEAIAKLEKILKTDLAKHND